jgi:DNA gyrase/topoisomerase IV subunit A
MIEKMAELVRDKRIEGISDICATNPTARAMRVVIELKRDAVADVSQPALPLHAAADLVRGQHGGAQRRQAGTDER